MCSWRVLFWLWGPSYPHIWRWCLYADSKTVACSGWGVC